MVIGILLTYFLIVIFLILLFTAPGCPLDHLPESVVFGLAIFWPFALIGAIIYCGKALFKHFIKGK